MGKRTIKVGLSYDSIKEAAYQVQKYANTLDLKCEKFVDRLVNEVGIRVIRENIASFKGDSERDYNTYFELHRTPNKGVYGKLVAENEDILFIEFGAGIYYNNGNAHPQSKEFGYGVGTYPGQKNAINPGYWNYRDESGTLRFSLGTEATMPVYKAYIEMVSMVETIAREVFANG